ncbi:MAG: hypothetical protein GY906_22615 [bacterium]|nr:hypothetical protein [bacterium]
MRDPVLAAKTIKPAWSKVSLTIKACGGLHYLRGNSAPYFTLTADQHRKGFPHQCQSGGADHEAILKHWPQFADLAALHLSDINGTPMHAEANGWYALAGALPDNAGEKFHCGNSEQHMPKPPEKRQHEWDATEYRKPTPDECLAQFARHARISVETAQTVCEEVVCVFNEWWTHELSRPETERRTQQACWQRARQRFGEWIADQQPRWKREADECIQKYALKVYGDKWKAV